jgi:flagellar capping protein FliD
MSGLMGVSGIASGVDWSSIITQLKELEYKKIDLVKSQQKTAQDKLSTWQSINTKLLSLKTVVGKINEPADFNLFSPALSSNTSKDADDLLSVTAGTSASRGTYNITVNSLAAAQKVSSQIFASDTTALGLSGDIVVNGKTVTVSATDTLSSLRDKINGVNTGTDPSKVTASIVHYGTADYRLIFTSDEEGAAGMTLENGGAPDILGALGISDTIRGVTGDIANVDGGVPITPSTLIKDIDGYTTWVSGDRITFLGTDTNGNTVNTNAFRIYSSTTVQNLLNAVEAAFGDVTAQVTADGRIQVIDNEAGDDQLRVALDPAKPALNFDTDNDFGAIYTIQTSEIQAGADASFAVDGVAVTRSSNTVDDLITGVTLNLKGADPATTVTVNVNRDYEKITEQITEFVTSYNDLIDTINEQLTYDTATQEPGGPLFGDSTLRSLKTSLVRTIVSQVPGLDQNFSALGQVGINLDNDGNLAIDSDTLQGYLETNFEDVKNLFVTSTSSTNSAVTYIDHNYKTQAGTYNINITGVSPVAGYFSAAGDASGSGEYLTGISGNAQGLVVRYSGTGTGSIGSFTLTYGVAELLDRSLYQITDSTYGYLPDKQEAIQDTIKDYDETIATMEARVEKKMEELELRFIKMESAMSSMQSLSSWLSSQIKSLSG